MTATVDIDIMVVVGEIEMVVTMIKMETMMIIMMEVEENVMKVNTEMEVEAELEKDMMVVVIDIEMVEGHNKDGDTGDNYDGVEGECVESGRKSRGVGSDKLW